VAWSHDLPPYDPKHPDELTEGHVPLLFVVDGRPVGTIRIDVDRSVAWFRLITISDEVQGRGYGRRMLEMAEDFARSHGCRTVRCNVEPDALGFYERLGFRSAGEWPMSLIKDL
jgi:GNAT superfamily N-acetyltransferase